MATKEENYAKVLGFFKQHSELAFSLQEVHSNMEEVGLKTLKGITKNLKRDGKLDVHYVKKTVKDKNGNKHDLTVAYFVASKEVLSESRNEVRAGSVLQQQGGHQDASSAEQVHVEAEQATTNV